MIIVIIIVIIIEQQLHVKLVSTCSALATSEEWTVAGFHKIFNMVNGLMAQKPLVDNHFDAKMPAGMTLSQET